MIYFPNAKINIGLNIIHKREDGYHNIESVFYPVGLSDILEVVENEDSQHDSNIDFNISGISVPGHQMANLCVKALKLIKKDYSLPAVRVHLHKIIPTGAGLGGGSSDGAFLIRLINEKFNLGMSFEQMSNYAEPLGSDCSFFIGNKPSYIWGRGEKIEQINLNLEKYYLVIVCPGIHISTQEAYALVVPKKPAVSIKEFVKYPLSKWKETIFNDFEDSLFPKFPALGAIKEKMYAEGAIYSSMSGSGSSIYGIFNEKVDGKKIFSQYFVWEGDF